MIFNLLTVSFAGQNIFNFMKFYQLLIVYQDKPFFATGETNEDVRREESNNEDSLARAQ